MRTPLTDEIVERALDAYRAALDEQGAESQSKAAMRAALEAVWPRELLPAMRRDDEDPDVETPWRAGG